VSFVGCIGDARDIEEVYELVNEFVDAVYYSGQTEGIPVASHRIGTADDLWHALTFVSDEINRRKAAFEGIPDVILTLRAVLETALQRVRSVDYH
jgi:hypothetical protein